MLETIVISIAAVVFIAAGYLLLLDVWGSKDD